MDLGTVTDLVPTADPADWREGDAWLAGSGDWLRAACGVGVHDL